MKKLLIVMAVIVSGLTASAQWSAGLRVGSALEAVGQYSLSDKNYIEARFGMIYANPGGTIFANFDALYNWRLMEMNWTKGTGPWYFDAGVGVNAGGRDHYAFVGVALMARLGVQVTENIGVALDWTPSFGPEIAYGNGYSHSSFNKYGLANAGITFLYKF